MFVMCSVASIGTVVFLSLFTKFSDLSLYAPRFIERPQDSSWYLIHNGNTTSKTINGITSNNLKSYKEIYLPVGWNRYCYDDILNSVNIYNCKTTNNPNAIYGYMAWNLGNTKIFCPQSVDFFDNEGDNKDKSTKCLVIDGRYLQPISEYYLVR